MSRGKQFTPENADTAGTVVPGDEAELKARNASAKVTLVKPLQAEPAAPAQEEAPLAEAQVATEKAPVKKSRARPKVGRSSTTRKKKSEGGEKKTGKSKSKSAARAAKIEGSLTEETKPEVPPVAEAEPEDEILLQAVESVPASEPLRIEQLQAELKQMELSTDYWELTQSKPWSFGRALIVVMLFIGVSWSLMELFSHGGHRHSTAASIPAASTAEPAVTPAPSAPPEATASMPATEPSAVPPPAPLPLPEKISSLPPALPTVPRATIQAATAGMPSAPASPSPAANETIAPLPAAAAPSQEPVSPAPGAKTNDKQQELFSILNKDE